MTDEKPARATVLTREDAMQLLCIRNHLALGHADMACYALEAFADPAMTKINAWGWIEALAGGTAADFAPPAPRSVVGAPALGDFAEPSELDIEHQLQPGAATTTPLQELMRRCREDGHAVCYADLQALHGTEPYTLKITDLPPYAGNPPHPFRGVSSIPCGQQTGPIERRTRCTSDCTCAARPYTAPTPAPTQAVEAAEREKFETWAKSLGIDCTLWMPTQPQVGYSNTRTNDYYLGWVSRAELSKEVAAPVELDEAALRRIVVLAPKFSDDTDHAYGIRIARAAIAASRVPVALGGGEAEAERQRCADICMSRFRSLSADGNLTAANEAHKCASAVLYASRDRTQPPKDAAPVAVQMQHPGRHDVRINVTAQDIDEIVNGTPVPLQVWEYTDEQLAAGVKALEFCRSRGIPLSDETVAGIVYDYMTAAGPKRPLTIYMDEDPIDVEQFYRAKGFEKLPATPTMTGQEIRDCGWKKQHEYQMFIDHGNTGVPFEPIGTTQAIVLVDGMRFISIPPATW